MKTNYLKRSLWLAAILLTSLCAKAQTSATSKTAYDDEERNMYYRIYNEGGNRAEHIKTEYNGKTYKMEMVNEKLTSLYVNGEKIAEADWSKYDDAIRHIREEIKAQIKRNEEQAKRNAEQAVRNQAQAQRNEVQAKRNEEQNVRNQEQAKRNEEQAQLNELQVKRNEEQAVHNQEQDKRNAEQAVRNEEQAKKNAEQEVKNKDQAERNELQAKKNEEQAKANEQMIKDITNDLVADKIIPDTNSLHEMRLSEFGMSVNGVKQPEEVFKKYRAKYNKVFNGTFSYSRDGIIQEH
jgi:colicin import membrane protein